MVMMEQAFWLILFLAVVGIAALIAAAMMWQKESIQHTHRAAQLPGGIFGAGFYRKCRVCCNDVPFH